MLISLLNKKEMIDIPIQYVFFFCLSAQRSVMAMMIIPLPHYDNLSENILKSEKKVSETMNIHIIMYLCHFCDYYVIITSHSYVASMRGQKNS